MVKPIDSSQSPPPPPSSEGPEVRPLLSERPAPAPSADFRPAPWMQSGGLSNSTRQGLEAQVRHYRSVEAQLERASKCLSALRVGHYTDRHLLVEARSFLDTARLLYRNHFPSNAGSFTLQEAGQIFHYDVESLNTRLNATELAFRRASQIVEA